MLLLTIERSCVLPCPWVQSETQNFGMKQLYDQGQIVKGTQEPRWHLSIGLFISPFPLMKG